MRRIATISAALAIALVGACKRESKEAGPVVATGDGFTITAAELKRKLAEQAPFVRARYATLERKKEFVENLIRFELLAAEARKRGLDKDPEVQETLEKIMVQKLVRSAFEEKGAGERASDDEVRTYYDQHLDEFVRPERVRVAQIHLRADASAQERARKRADAAKLLARLKSEGKKNPLAFATIARDASEDHSTKEAGGDLGYRTREELERLLGRQVADAAVALSDMGQESGVVESTQGFHILKLQARLPAVHRSFEEVKPQLAARLGREKRTQDFDAFVKKLREASAVKIDEKELDKVAVEAPPSSVQAASPNGPPPPIAKPATGAPASR
jgi:peptidyl-prolyl cis-trans isomerase C